MRKYRKKPVVVEAMQYRYPDDGRLKSWMGSAFGVESKQRHPGARGELEVYTLEDGSLGQAKHVARDGDWIIRGVNGEFYPCKPDIFAATYERAI